LSKFAQISVLLAGAFTKKRIYEDLERRSTRKGNTKYVLAVPVRIMGKEGI
jgi:hypothetical protein